MPPSVFTLILQRFIRRLGPRLFFWVVVPILVIVIFNLLMLLAAYVECRAFGVAHVSRTPTGFRSFVCG
jgi:hypothetical protein